MFDLESGIRDWRQALLARETLRAEHLDELEDHLREQYASLRSPVEVPSRLSEEESFLIATRRLGGVDALAGEFAKADPGALWRRRAILMLAGYLGIGFAVALARSAGVLAAFSFAGPVGAPGWVAWNFAGTLLVLLGVAALARSFVRGGWAARVPGTHAGKLLSPIGLALATLAAIAATAAIAPLSPVIVTVGAIGGLMQSTKVLTPYPGVLVALAPFALLALLVWRDRERLRREAGSAVQETRG